MTYRQRTSIPLIAVAITGALAAFAFAPSSTGTDSVALASAFPIAQAQFAR